MVDGQVDLPLRVSEIVFMSETPLFNLVTVALVKVSLSSKITSSSSKGPEIEREMMYGQIQ